MKLARGQGDTGTRGQGGVKDATQSHPYMKRAKKPRREKSFVVR